VNGGSTEHGYNTTISATDDLAAKKAADQINAAIQSAYDLNAHDEMTGSTLLIWAAQLGISESVTKLLEHGADPNLGSQDHAITPLMTAARHHKLNTLELLLPLSAIDQCDSKGATALSVCAECGNHLGITMLTEAEADINKPDKNGFTPLFVAVQHG
jgi:ankyrin repeat protein